MRHLRIAELNPCQELNDYIEDLSRIKDLVIDRYFVPFELFNIPISGGGLNFPIATLDHVKGQPNTPDVIVKQIFRVFGIDEVVSSLKDLCVPAFAVTKRTKRFKEHEEEETRVNQEQRDVEAIRKIIEP